MALIKAGWLELLGLDQQPAEGYNCLPVKVDALLADTEGPTEVRLLLASGQTLCAFADAHWLQDHQVIVGSDLQVQFQPSYVLLGTPL
ncbi:DNA-binding transcriptional regulator ModE [compost metagenome]